MKGDYSLLHELNGNKENWKIKARVTRLWDVYNLKNRDFMSLDMVLLDEQFIKSAYTFNIGKMKGDYSLLHELNGNKENWKIKARVTRLWDVYNLKNRDFMSLDMVLLDEQGNHIHARIKDAFVHQFRESLQEGNIYYIRNFGVIPYQNDYKIVTNEHSIKFYATTIVKPAGSDNLSIPKYKFEFVPFEHLSGRCDKNVHLTDVIGRVSTIFPVYENDKNGKPLKRRIIKIEDKRKRKIQITLWGDLAESITEDACMDRSKSTILIITSTTVKSFKNQLSLSSTYATKVYISLDYQQDYIHWDCEEVVKNKRTIHEIIKFLEQSKSQEAIFYCMAVVKKVNAENGWHYISCTNCHKKAKTIGSTFWCKGCKKGFSSPTRRYRLELRVEDESGSTIFVVFDKEAEKIVRIPATQVYTTEIKDEDDDEDVVPKPIKNLLGKTYMFQIKINPNNIFTTKQNFTAIHVFEDHAYKQLHHEQEEKNQILPLKRAIDVDVEIEREVPKAKRNGYYWKLEHEWQKDIATITKLAIRECLQYAILSLQNLIQEV
nr:replication protein a 70 kda dna-binding subunit b [Quercus suber]